MRNIAIAAAMALGSTLAMAQSAGAGGGAAGAGVGNQSDPHVGEYWDKNAKDGHMTRDQAMGYRTKDGKAYMHKSGKPMEYAAVDADSDGRVSKVEWMNYFGGEARGAGTPEAGNPTATPGSTGGTPPPSR